MSQGQMRTRDPLGYAAYLLRLWRETRGETAQWRASLQDPHTGERVGFASLAELFTFLENETQSSLPGSQHPEEEGK